MNLLINWKSFVKEVENKRFSYFEKTRKIIDFVFSIKYEDRI